MSSLQTEISEEQQTAGGSYGGWNGFDEFGRIWKRGSYIGGALKSWEDIDRFIPPLRFEERTLPSVVRECKGLYPDKAYSFSFHTGPFGLTMESMGFEHFLLCLFDDRELVKEVVRRRTEWFVEICKYVETLGPDFFIMGDDVAYKNKTFVSPADFKELVIPYYKQIVESVKAPVFWHSDGFIEPLIELAIGAGIKGLHAIEPTAGNDLGRIKQKYGHKLVLIGNVDCVETLTQKNLEFVRRDVDRCMNQAKRGGGYMLGESNSFHSSCTFEAVIEMYKYALEVGKY
jgi:uroporphyrinogen decarboxylase